MPSDDSRYAFDSPYGSPSPLYKDTQRVSRGKLRLLSAHDRQIYVTRPYDGYRTSSCVADSSRLCPASNLPALYPLGYGAYLYVDPRFCLQLPSGAHRCYALAFGYPSPPSGWVWTLPNICVINIKQHHLAAGPCPAHIGIGPPLTGRPSHTTVRTGPYTAVRLIRQNQIQGNKRPSDVK